MVWADVTISPVANEQGQVEKHVYIHTDITERKQAEAALREREARLSSILKTVPDAIIVIDAFAYDAPKTSRMVALLDRLVG